MYECLTRWLDFEDHHLYNTGDKFPHDGRVISERRITELSGTQNKAGFALIKAVAVENEEKPVLKAETPKKATRSRKKAV